VVWIKVSPGVLAQRIQGDSQTADRRPSLTGKSVTDEVAEVLAAREPLYRSASTLIVDAETLSVQEVAQKILAHLSRTPAGEHRA
jgi:shikimate kinase